MRTTIVLGILFVFCHGCSVTTLERTEETAVISCEAAHVTIQMVPPVTTMAEDEGL